MIRVLARGALVPAALFVVVACSASPPPESATVGQPARTASTAAGEPPTSDAAGSGTPVATGIRVTGATYAFNAPVGWRDISEQLARSGAEVDTGVGEDPAEMTTVRENLSVSVVARPGMTLDAYERSAARSLAYLIEDLETYDREVIDGHGAAHVGGEANTGEASFVFEQYAVVRGDTMYTVSFTLDEGRPETDRNHLIDSVLASWEWQS